MDFIYEFEDVYTVSFQLTLLLFLLLHSRKSLCFDETVELLF